MLKDKERVFRLTLWGSFLLYTTSLFFSGYSTINSSEDNYGFLLVAFGWSEVFSDGSGYVWLANPLLWASWGYRKKIVRSFLFSALAVIIASLFYFSSKVMPIGACGNWLESYDCSPVEITRINAGYYFWLFSCFIMALGNLLRMKINGSKKMY